MAAEVREPARVFGLRNRTLRSSRHQSAAGEPSSPHRPFSGGHDKRGTVRRHQFHGRPGALRRTRRRTHGGPRTSESTRGARHSGPRSGLLAVSPRGRDVPTLRRTSFLRPPPTLAGRLRLSPPVLFHPLLSLALAPAERLRNPGLATYGNRTSYGSPRPGCLCPRC